jgi:DNA polymerase I
MNKVLLIDVMSEAFRSFHALPKTILSTDGILINALLGFHNSLKRLIDQFEPTLCLTAWTSPGPTFRHALFPGYKSNRSLPDGLATQKPLISSYLAWLKIPQFLSKGFEADDVLATLATHFASLDCEVVIDTVDKDLWSLCNSAIKIWAPTKKTLVGPEDVLKRFEVHPAQLPDLLAFTGDDTDGVPRIPGISGRQAISLLETYGSLRAILDKHLGELPEAQRTKVQQNRDLLELNLRLTSLCNSVSLDLADVPYDAQVSERLNEATALLKAKDISLICSECSVSAIAR